jgi:cell division protein FtsB
MASPRSNQPLRRETPRSGRSLLTGLLLLLSAFFVLDGIAGERGWLANRRARLEYEREVLALQEARQRNDALREEIRRLRSDPALIEELARRELKLAKPNETVFIIRDKK